MAGHGVHPGYVNMRESIMSSEVLASKYANEVTKAGYEGNKDDVICHMEQLDGILKESGVVLQDDILEVFAEVTVVLGEQGKTELMGKIPMALSKLYKSSVHDQTRSITYIEKLKSLTEELSEQVMDLRRTSITMKAVVPRMKIKAKRIQTSAESKESRKKQSNTAMETDIQDTTERAEEMTPDNTGHTKQDENDHNLILATDVNPESGTARRMRDNYRQYYSYIGFSTLPHNQQVALIEYYMTHIIRVTMSEVEDDSEIYSMFSDLIDKERMMAYCKLAEEEELTSDMIEDAMNEMVDIINACSSAYGNYQAEIVARNGNPAIYIKSM